MTCRLTALVVDALEPVRVARFWADILGREALGVPDGVLVPGTETQLGLRFVSSPVRKVGRDRMHLHLTSTDAADQQHVVATALRLGASHLDVGQLPEERHVVLADPEGNELCVIEPGTSYLAGCGFLGELTCEGTREVGFFWAAALGWPIVWDEGLQTAIQSPLGGTKVSWDGPPSPRRGPDRQRFDLTLVDGDLPDEVARLTALGATPLGTSLAGSREAAVRLTDPDGTEFLLRASDGLVSDATRTRRP
jgi:hypothetical protein